MGTVMGAARRAAGPAAVTMSAASAAPAPPPSPSAPMTLAQRSERLRSQREGLKAFQAAGLQARSCLVLCKSLLRTF